MIPGIALLALSGLMVWRGFTGQSPVEEVRKLLAGEAIFVKTGSSSLVGSPSGTGPGGESAGELVDRLGRESPLDDLRTGGGRSAEPDRPA